jgi:hypothetical protein
VNEFIQLGESNVGTETKIVVSGQALVEMPTQEIRRTPLPCEPVLLLTGCIDPKGMRFTARNDPAVRRKDYMDALRSWVFKSDFKKIVLCENSGADLSDFQEMVKGSGKEVELISYVAPEFEEWKGKGYGELLIIEHAMENSKLIDEHSRVMKCTGRLFFSSHKKYYNHGVNGEFDFSMDVFRSLDECDVRAFFGSYDFITKYLLPFKERLDERTEPMQNLEHVMGQAVFRALSDLLKYEPLPATPFFVGHSGTLNYAYKPYRTIIGRHARVIHKRYL